MGYEVSDFQKEVIERSHSIPVLVDFWADWCGPCKILGPVLERLAARADSKWALAKVDTEQLTDIALKYNVQSIPNVKLFVDGVVVNEFVGALPEYQIQRWLETAIPSKHRKLIEQAEAFVVAGSLEPARALLEKVLSLEPGNTNARILLARALAFSEPAQAAAMIANLDEPKHADVLNAIRVVARLHTFATDPGTLPDGEVRKLYHTAIQHLAAGDFDTAIGEFIQVIRENRSYDEDGSRKACIAIFKLLGEEHAVTQKHRRDFSSALY
jgi:putative thioredoxin